MRPVPDLPAVKKSLILRAASAVALAGIGEIPDTILDRAVLVPMQRPNSSAYILPADSALLVPASR